jgi:hypothetical protein
VLFVTQNSSVTQNSFILLVGFDVLAFQYGSPIRPREPFFSPNSRQNKGEMMLWRNPLGANPKLTIDGHKSGHIEVASSRMRYSFILLARGQRKRFEVLAAASKSVVPKIAPHINIV